MLEFPTPAHVRRLSRDQFCQAASPVVGRRVNKIAKLNEIWEMSQNSAALPHPPESIAVETFRLTWSFAVYHAWILLPLFLLPGIPIVRWLFSADMKSLDDIAPLFFLVPLLAGLMAHEFAWMATGHTGPGSPGWYFHILVGPLSYAWARGWRDSMAMRWIFGLTLAFTVVLWGCELAVFSGTAVPDTMGHLAWNTAWWRIDFKALSNLGFPALGLAFLFVATALSVACFKIIRGSKNVHVFELERGLIEPMTP